MDLKEQFISELEDTLNRLPEEAIKILHDPKYEGVLEDTSWELIPRLFDNITKKNSLGNYQLYNGSVDLLLEIARIDNSEDLLFEFIEHAEKQNNNCRFIITLKALKMILLRLHHRRGIAIGWCCNAIIRYLSEYSFPQNIKLEGEEQLILENDDTFQELELLFIEVLDFLSPFVKEISGSQCTIPEQHMDVYKDAILKTLLKLFDYPLVNSHLEHTYTKGAFRAIAENVLNLVDCFSVDLLSFLEFVVSNDNDSSLDSEYSNTSLGVFYYMILVEGVFIEKIPYVYSRFYLLRQLTWLSMTLMKSEDVCAQWKGLSLAENALKRISDKEIVFEEASRVQCKEFAGNCTQIMIYSESKRNREKSVTIFHKFLRIFDPRGRFYMLLSVQELVKEPGFIGYLATRCKDFISEALSNKNLQELKYFTGKCLKDLIRKFCWLEDGAETDIVRHADQIIPCLNLLRYLIIRDTGNSSGFFDLIPVLNNSYFTLLKKAIEISKAHYMLQKKEMSQPSNSEDLKTCTSVMVGGLGLPQLSDEQKFQIIDRSMNIIDLIDSLLSRVIECIHDRKLL